MSGDGDRTAIEDPRLDVLDNIAKFLDRFPDPIIANQVRAALKASSQFVKKVKRAFEDTDFYEVITTPRLLTWKRTMSKSATST